jgi:hypothetical protein
MRTGRRRQTTSRSSYQYQVRPRRHHSPKQSNRTSLDGARLDRDRDGIAGSIRAQRGQFPLVSSTPTIDAERSELADRAEGLSQMTCRRRSSSLGSGHRIALAMLGGLRVSERSRPSDPPSPRRRPSIGDGKLENQRPAADRRPKSVNWSEHFHIRWSSACRIDFQTGAAIERLATLGQSRHGQPRTAQPPGPPVISQLAIFAARMPRRHSGARRRQDRRSDRAQHRSLQHHRLRPARLRAFRLRSSAMRSTSTAGLPHS